MNTQSIGISVSIPVFCNIDTEKAISAVKTALMTEFPTAQLQVTVDDFSDGETCVSDNNEVVMGRIDSIVGDALDLCIA